MFEHLGHTPDIKNIKPKTNYKVYFSFLLFGVMFFLFAFSINRGPGSVAQTYVSPQVKIFVNSADKQVSVDTPQFSVFDFSIQVDKDDVYLENLTVSTNGLFDLDIFSDLKLFNDNTQIGSVLEIDNSGNIHFVLEDYSLQEGKNNFSFILVPEDSIKIGDVVNLGFEKNTSIFLSYKGKLFNAKGEFPVAGGLVTVVEKGSLQAFNNFKNSGFYITSGSPDVVASFSLAATAEAGELSRLVFDIDSEEELEQKDFALLSNGKLLAKGFFDEGQLVFNVDDTFKLSVSSQENFELHALSLPVGKYSFTLTEAYAKGFVSGKGTSLTRSLSLGDIEAVEFIPKFYAGELSQTLSEGWNTLYSLEVKSRGSDDLKINKLTWSIDGNDVEISEAEIWVDNKPYISDVVIGQNTITMKTGWDDALNISKNVKIELLVKVKDVEKGDYLQANLLTDKEPKLGEDFKDNILWSQGDDVFNGYQLPYLPLEPSVLSN